MHDLIAVERIAQWEKLKTLVLDSVSSPITKRVYNMALNEFMAWFQHMLRRASTKATVSAWRVSLEERRLGSSSIIIRMSAIRKLAGYAATTDCSRRNPGAWYQPREEREIDRAFVWGTGYRGAGRRRHSLSAPDISTVFAPARPRHPRRAPWLRPPAIGSGVAHIRARPAARWALPLSRI